MLQIDGGKNGLARNEDADNDDDDTHKRNKNV